ncbi:MAG: class I SAM-dependent methyltransferase [Myxococcales bacterium]
MGQLEDRLKKRSRHLARWAARERVTAYRLFDRDIPSYHFAVDRYGDWAVVHEYPWKEGDRLHQARRAELLAALASSCDLPADRVVFKVHRRHPWGESQYGKGEGERRLEVVEDRLRFEVDLGPRLDTGLFLDHRRTRAIVRGLASGKRFLNLFCYTGSFTVYAAAGGARSTTSVDLSRGYLDWAKRNLALNGLAGPAHRFVQADASRWLDEGGDERFDLVVLDPPPFSASGRMARAFEVQRDHRELIERTRRRVAPGGALFFSTSYQGFELDPSLRAAELTPGSLPEDFKGKHPHRCWRFDS